MGKIFILFLSKLTLVAFSKKKKKIEGAGAAGGCVRGGGAGENSWIRDRDESSIPHKYFLLFKN